MPKPRRPPERQVFSVGAFGINVVDAPTHLPDGSLTSAQNAAFDKIDLVGGIRKRCGMVRVGSIAAAAAPLAFHRILLPDSLPLGDPDGDGPTGAGALDAPIWVFSGGCASDPTIPFPGWGTLPNPPAPPTGITVDEGLTGGDFGRDAHDALHYYVWVAAIDGAGAFSDPDPFNPAGESTTLYDGTRTIQVSWTASPDAVKYRCLLGWHYYRILACQYIETTGLSCEFTKNPAWVPGLKTCGLDILASEITPGAALATYSEARSYQVAGLTGLLERGALSVVNTGHCVGYRRPIHLDWLAVTGADGGYRLYVGSPGTAMYAYQDVGPGVLEFDDDLLGTGWIPL